MSQAFVEAGYRLAYTNLSLPGMSGGPVLDVSGQVIGINAGIENEIGLGYGVPSSSILSLATQAGLKKESLKVVSTKLPSLKDSEIALLANHPLFAIKKPSADATENDLFQYANKMWRINRHSEAIPILQDIIKRKPDFYQAYFFLGGVLSETDPEKALAALDKATMLKPDYYEAWMQKSNLLFKLKKDGLALAAIDKAIEYNNDDWSLYLFRSFILYDLKRYPEALATIDKAIQINPFYLNYSMRTIIRFHSQDYQGMLADLNEVIKLQPDFDWAYALRGLLYDIQKKWDLAVADYNQAIKLRPDNAHTYFWRGTVYQRQGNDRAALADYNQALTKDGKLVAAIINIGHIKYEEGDVEGAIQQWEKAGQINGSLAQPQMALAVALYAKGEQQKALNMAQAALHLDKSFADVEVLKQNLWGTHLIDEARKLLSHPTIQALQTKQ
ncbi:MAG: tetratricopeptide repeat protein [Nostoc sp.]